MLDALVTFVKGPSGSNWCLRWDASSGECIHTLTLGILSCDHVSSVFVFDGFNWDHPNEYLFPAHCFTEGKISIGWSRFSQSSDKRQSKTEENFKFIVDRDGVLVSKSCFSLVIKLNRTVVQNLEDLSMGPVDLAWICTCTYTWYSTSSHLLYQFYHDSHVLNYALHPFGGFGSSSSTVGGFFLRQNSIHFGRIPPSTTVSTPWY